MLKIDAVKILGLSGNITKKDIKQAYRKAAAMYHPDKNPAGKEMMQAVNAAYELLKNLDDFEFAVEVDQEHTNYGAELNEALNAIIDIPDINIEVCGAWVWVTGNTKPYSQRLGNKSKGGAGFKFNRKKSAWFFRPADWKSRSRGNWSLEDIRGRYGSDSIRTQPNPQLN